MTFYGGNPVSGLSGFPATTYATFRSAVLPESVKERNGTSFVAEDTTSPCPRDAVHPRIFLFYHCYSRWPRDPVKHRNANKDSMSLGWHGHLGDVLVPFVRGQSINQGNCHLQQLVTAKLLATSRLSMWGVSLNSEVPNWTIPIRNALYSWSAPLGNRPPVIDSKKLSFSIVKYKNTYFNGIVS